MNIKKLLKLNFVINLIIFLIAFSLSIYFNYMLNKNVLNLLEYKRINTTGISFLKFKELKEKSKDLTLTGYSESICNIKNSYNILPGKDIKSKTVLTDENYLTLYNYKMIEGEKLDHLSVENGNKIAVISDNLAITLYKNTKVIGNTITLNNDIYKIVGVYKTNTSFTYSISDDGYERIIIPYSAYNFPNKNTNLVVDIFAINEKDKNTSQKINNKLYQTLGANMALYNPKDYTLSKQVIFQYTKIICFLIGSYIIIFLIKLLIRYFKDLVMFFKDKLQKQYFLMLIKNYKKEILAMSTRILLCLASIIIIFNIIKFNIVINDKYLPSDNIFDFGFYKDAFIKNAHIINANENGLSNVYDRYLSTISAITQILFVIQVLTFIKFTINTKELRLNIT